jgi:hypothetical protein
VSAAGRQPAANSEKQKRPLAFAGGRNERFWIFGKYHRLSSVDKPKGQILRDPRRRRPPRHEIIRFTTRSGSISCRSTSRSPAMRRQLATEDESPVIP